MTIITRRSLLVRAGSALALATSASILAETGSAVAKIRHDASARTYGPVGIMGDSSSSSYLNGLNTQLAKSQLGPYRYDIRGSRRITTSWLTYDSGVKAATKMKNSGFDPPAWVVGLGSNDFYFFRRQLLSPVTEIEALLDVLGADRHVAWLTIWTKRAGTYHRTFNDALSDVATRRPNLHVVDWASIAKQHPEWLMADGAHLKMSGAKARNLFIAEAAVTACHAAGAVH